MRQNKVIEYIWYITDELYELDWSTLDIQEETGVITYDWSETLNDLELMGVDTSKLDTKRYYGYDVNNNREVTSFDYLGELFRLLQKAIKEI